MAVPSEIGAAGTATTAHRLDFQVPVDDAGGEAVSTVAAGEVAATSARWTCSPAPGVAAGPRLPFRS